MYHGKRPGRLKQGQTRYYTDVDDLPPDFVGGRSSRACIEEVGKVDRYEIDFDPELSLSCTDCIDCGSIGRPAKVMFYSAGGGRGMLWFDRCHTRFNRFKSAVGDAGIWDSGWNEACVLGAYRRGPWLGAANHGRVVAVFTNFWQASTHKSKLYRFCYPMIVRFMYKGQPPSNAYTEDHYSEVWLMLPFRSLLTSPGTKAKKSRWYQTVHNINCMYADLGLLMLISLVMALNSGHYASLSDTPFATKLPAVEAPAAPVVAATSSSSSSSSAAAPAPASEPVEETPIEKEQLKNQTQVVTNILCDWQRLRTIVLITRAGYPQIEGFYNEYDDLKSSGTVKDWWVKVATRDWNNVIFQLASQFTSKLVLKDLD